MLTSSAKYNLLLSRSIRALIVMVCLVFSLTTFLQAQSKKSPDDIIHLRDGSIYKGQIIEENDEYIYMVIIEGQTISIPQREVKRMMNGKNYLFHNNRRFHYTKGFFWNVKLGFSVIEDEGAEHFSFLMGYRFNKRFSVGIGLGSELGTSKVGGFDVETIFASYFAEGRYYLTNNRQRLFTYGRLGYGSGPSETNESGRHGGGFQTQGGIGIHFASRKRIRFIMSFGYHTQYTNGEQFFRDGLGSEVRVQYEDLWVDHFVFKFGVEFR